MFDMADSSLRKEDMICLVCRDIVLNPVQCGICGVIYCGLCMPSDDEKKCKNLNYGQHAINAVKPSLPWLNLYEKTVVYCKCKPRGCEEKVLIKDYIHHITYICKFSTQQCINQSCNEKIFYSDIDKHTSKDCLFAVIDCPNKGCDKKFFRKDTGNHLKNCQFKNSCVSCEVSSEEKLKKYKETKKELKNLRKINEKLIKENEEVKKKYEEDKINLKIAPEIAGYIYLEPKFDAGFGSAYFHYVEKDSKAQLKKGSTDWTNARVCYKFDRKFIICFTVNARSYFGLGLIDVADSGFPGFTPLGIMFCTDGGSYYNNNPISQGFGIPFNSLIEFSYDPSNSKIKIKSAAGYLKVKVPNVPNPVYFVSSNNNSYMKLYSVRIKR